MYRLEGWEDGPLTQRQGGLRLSGRTVSRTSGLPGRLSGLGLGLPYLGMPTPAFYAYTIESVVKRTFSPF